MQLEFREYQPMIDLSEIYEVLAEDVEETDVEIFFDAQVEALLNE